MKTSRTLGQEENDVSGTQVNMKSPGQMISVGKVQNSVIKRAPRIHRRNRVRRIPYYLRKPKEIQRVSSQFLIFLENNQKTLYSYDGSITPCGHKDSRSNSTVFVQKAETCRNADPLLPEKTSAAGEKLPDDAD
jgi:hypothetical protein